MVQSDRTNNPSYGRATEVNPTADVPTADLFGFRYIGSDPDDDIDSHLGFGFGFDDMPRDNDEHFGFRLPQHHVAPSEKPMPSDTGGYSEIIKMLKAAEERSKANVTQADLEKVANSVAAGFKELGNRMDGAEATLRMHAIAIKTLDDRQSSGSGSGPVANLSSLRNVSYAPRRMSPMPQAIDVEKTAGGGIKIADGAQWDKVIRRLDDQEQALGEIEAERDAAKAAEHLANERQAAVQEYANKQTKRVKKLVAALIAGGPTIGAAVHFLLKYFHQ
jgi:hypothetical protein